MKNKLIFLLVVVVVIMYSYMLNLSFKDKSVLNNNQEKEDYILGVLACEMPALYEDDALLAQAIAIRTFAYYTDKFYDSNEQCYINDDGMMEKWGNSYNLYKDKLKKIVKKTEDIVMKKENKLFKSYYFSTSNGYTLDSMSVFKEGNLTGVKSEDDINSKNYLRETTFTKEELENKLGSFNEINILSRDDTNHVLSVEVDDKEYTGIEFRKILNLRSTDFDISYDSFYKITTRGYGHGVGMSQNGANELAKKGKNYEEILKYYYGDINLVKINV